MIETIPEPADPALVELVDSSVPFRTASKTGDRFVAAWRSSAMGRAVSTWLAIPLDRRIRLVSTVVAAAVVTHVVLTRFRAPEPTWLARAAWIGIVLTAAFVGVCSRAFATAWSDWTSRRMSGDRAGS